LKGTTAVVTGAAHGQGRSHAVRLAQLGAAVVCIDICEPVATVQYPTGTWEELAETAKLVESVGSEALARKADVRDLPALEAIAAEIEEVLPPVTTVVANAGISGYQRLLDVTPAEWSFAALLRERAEDSAWFNASFAPILEMPEGGMLDPNIISDAVAWHASPESRYITGAFIPVDAGVTVR
jgi:NAD(P)-dependent dehydrogenase (short-subunit alcohol dehydrogenase family)